MAYDIRNFSLLPLRQAETNRNHRLGLPWLLVTYHRETIYTRKERGNVVIYSIISANF